MQGVSKKITLILVLVVVKVFFSDPIYIYVPHMGDNLTSQSVQITIPISKN